MTSVGLIGAGRMGAPIIRRLVTAGHDVTALGRAPDRRTALAEMGARAVGHVADVADGADVVVVCVFSDDQVRQICVDSPLLQAMSAGALLVIHTTGSPDTVTSIAVRAASYGIEVVDAPMSGGPRDIATGEVTLFVGGADGAVARIKPVLLAYADPVLHVGTIGAGQRMKLVNNALFAAQVELLAEAVLLGDHLGIAESTLLSALLHGSGASHAMHSAAMAGSITEFISMTGEFVIKDVALIRQIVGDIALLPRRSKPTDT